MFDFRDKDLRPISPYELKEFLENVFSRETSEYIMNLDEVEQIRINSPRDLNAECLEHLCCHYDSSDTKGEFLDRIESVKESLLRIRSSNKEYTNALRKIEDLLDEVQGLSIVY